MQDASFVKEIASLAGPKVITANNREYVTGTVQIPPEPDYPKLQLATLEGLLDYFADNRDGYDLKTLQILCTATEVQLLSKPSGENRKRDLLVVVKANALPPRLNEYMDLESFRIELLTRYCQTPDLETILKFVAKVSDSTVTTSDDDGISQTVTAKVGIVQHAQVQVPSPVTLNPIRTFIEVEQPEGKFLFRMKSGAAQSMPTAGLFEIQSNWQRAAALAVRRWLQDKIEADYENMDDLTILA